MSEIIVFLNELGGYSTPYDKDTLARLYYELQKENERLSAENAALQARLESAIELPRIRKASNYAQTGKYVIEYINKEDGGLDLDINLTKEQAEARLAELKGEN